MRAPKVALAQGSFSLGQLQRRSTDSAGRRPREHLGRQQSAATVGHRHLTCDQPRILQCVARVIVTGGQPSLLIVGSTMQCTGALETRSAYLAWRFHPSATVNGTSVSVMACVLPCKRLIAVRDRVSVRQWSPPLSPKTARSMWRTTSAVTRCVSIPLRNTLVSGLSCVGNPSQSPSPNNQATMPQTDGDRP